MPTTGAQWAWFFFWGGGAIGGWLVLAILVGEVVKAFRRGEW